MAEWQGRLLSFKTALTHAKVLLWGDQGTVKPDTDLKVQYSIPENSQACFSSVWKWVTSVSNVLFHCLQTSNEDKHSVYFSQLSGWELRKWHPHSDNDNSITALRLCASESLPISSQTFVPDVMKLSPDVPEILCWLWRDKHQASFKETCTLVFFTVAPKDDHPEPLDFYCKNEL